MDSKNKTCVIAEFAKSIYKTYRTSDCSNDLNRRTLENYQFYWNITRLIKRCVIIYNPVTDPGQNFFFFGQCLCQRVTEGIALRFTLKKINISMLIKMPRPIITLKNFKTRFLFRFQEVHYRKVLTGMKKSITEILS